MKSPISVAKPDITDLEIAEVVSVLKSGWLTQGDKVRQFEDELSQYVGAKEVLCVSSCTSGLFLSLKALGVGPGDEVIVPSYSFIATANAVAHTGATPVFADIEAEGVNLDVRSAASALSKKTRGIILVHQGGVPANITSFHQLTREKKLFLIEDAACAAGSSFDGRPIGSHSDFVVFSFHPRKILSTGEGGAIAYNGSDPNVVRYMRSARMHGMSISDLDRHRADGIVFERYETIGYNFKMTDIAAALGIAQLRRLNSMIEVRRKLFRVYEELLRGVNGLALPVFPSNASPNLQTVLLTVTEKFPLDAVEVMRRLQKRGIATRRGIMATHLEPAYSESKYSPRVALTNTAWAAAHNIVLPLHSGLSVDDCHYVAETLRSFC